MPLALEAWTLNDWTPRKSLVFGLYEEPPIYTASGDFVPPDNGMLLKVGQFNTHIQPS